MVRRDSLAIPVGITAAAYLLLILLVLSRHGWDPSYFVWAGERFCDPAAMPAAIQVMPKADGYDGQFYYRLAFDPSTTTQTDFGIRLDNPPYRQQRLLYPGLVWLLSAGNPHAVPMLMLAVNYLGLCGIAWIGARLAQSVGQPAVWGVVFSGYAGFVFTLSRDLTEIVAAVLILAALWSLRQGRRLGATLLLTLAALAKETTMLVVLGGLAALVVDARRGTQSRAREWTTFLVPMVAWMLWELFLMSRWGEFPVIAGRGNIGAPLTAFVSYFKSVANLERMIERRWFMQLCFLTAFALAVGLSLRTSTAPKHEKIAWFLYLIMALCFTRAIWVDDPAFLRALTDFYLLGMIVLLCARSPFNVVIVPWALVNWLLVFHMVQKHY